VSKTFYIVPHTHWDREWYQPFQVFRARLVEIVDDLLDILDQNPDFRHFLLDGHTAAPLDYLEIRPENEKRLKAAISSGRIATGPFHILMDEFLVSGETIVRNLGRGMAVAEELGGCSKIAYLPDMFGHISQMPQILRRAGIADAVVWRGVPSSIDKTLFRWEASDGTAVRTAYMATSYSNGAYLPSDPSALRTRLENLAEELDAFAPGDKYLIMNGTDHAPPQPDLPNVVNETAQLFGESARLKICSLAEYFDDLPQETDESWRGEFRSGARVNLLMGVVSNRVDIRRLTAETEDLLTRYAEPLAALYAPRISRHYFDVTWDLLIQNSAHDSICACSIDDVTDQVWSRLSQAHQIAKTTARLGMDALAQQAEIELTGNDVRQGTHRGSESRARGDEEVTRSYPGVVFFNPSIYPRAELAEIRVPLYGKPENLVLQDAAGSARPAQLLSAADPEILIDQTFPPAMIRAYIMAISSREVMGYFINQIDIDESEELPSVTIVVDTVPVGDLDIDLEKQRLVEFLERTEAQLIKITAKRPVEARILVQAPEIPALGWGAFPLVGGEPSPDSAEDGVRIDGGNRIENSYLSVEVAQDGTYTLEHKDSGLVFDGLGRLVDGGEWGDTYNYSPPPNDFAVSDPIETSVELAYNGYLGAGFRVVRRYSIPSHIEAATERRSQERLVDLVVEDLIELWAGEPFLRVTTEFRNDARDHRLRLHFPLPFKPEGSYGAGAFDVVARGLEAEGGPHEVGLPTFPARGFVDAWGHSASGDSVVAGIAILTGPVTEYEITDGELAVTLLRSTGMLSRPNSKLRPAGAGPSIPTEASQCIGSHRWRLAVMPHQGHWAEARVHEAAERFVYPLMSKETAPLAAATTGCRFEISSSNCIASALVPDHDYPVLRIWAVEGGGSFTLGSPAEEVSITGRPLPHGSSPRRYAPDEPIEVGAYEIKSLRLDL
jgi:mannosylglycerate hydrolase